MIVIIVIFGIMCGAMGGLTYWCLHQRKLLLWCDERERQLIPLIQCVHAIHASGSLLHGDLETQVDGVKRQQLIEVDVDPDTVPEGENWQVVGDRVYVTRPEFVPSRTGLGQLKLLEEMEATRRSLIDEMRKQYQNLLRWENEHPVPGTKPEEGPVNELAGLNKIELDEEDMPRLEPMGWRWRKDQ